jgi:hypothetical protein
MLQSCLMNIIGLKTYWVQYNIILITFGQNNMASFPHYGMGLVWPRNTSMLIGMRHCSIRWALIGFVKACSIAWTSVPQGPQCVFCVKCKVETFITKCLSMTKCPNGARVGGLWLKIYPLTTIQPLTPNAWWKKMWFAFINHLTKDIEYIHVW